MSNSKVKVIYIMGAGRSGTTAIATFLGSHPKILTLGEMHQFFEHLTEKKACSCGSFLETCSFWSKIVDDLPGSTTKEMNRAREIANCLEYHSSIPKHLVGSVKVSILDEYTKTQDAIFSAIARNYPSEYYLDSAKYIGRFLSLRKSNRLSIRAIYVVRDVRGVINSFSKNVQSSRSPLSAIFYYTITNITASIVSFFSPKGTVLRLRYEDFVADPEKSLKKIGAFLQINPTPVLNKIEMDDAFEIGHLIGGNRLKKKGKIKLSADEEWKKKQTRFKQILYFLLAAPVMLLYRYRV